MKKFSQFSKKKISKFISCIKTKVAIRFKKKLAIKFLKKKKIFQPKIGLALKGLKRKFYIYKNFPVLKL